MSDLFVKLSDILAKANELKNIYDPLNEGPARLKQANFSWNDFQKGINILQSIANVVLPDNKIERKYLPTVGELIDRLIICQQKEFLIPEHKKEYAEEIQDILSDIDSNIREKNIKFDAKTIRVIIVLALINREIWLNESQARKGNKEGCDLFLTHSLNGIRNRAKNKIQELLGGRKDFKTDCLGSEHMNWEPSWNEN